MVLAHGAFLWARRGGRILFGDQTLFCRARDFARVGGYNMLLPIMEDADLCIRMHMAGPEPPIPRSATLATSAAAAAAAASKDRAKTGKAPALNSKPAAAGGRASRSTSDCCNAVAERADGESGPASPVARTAAAVRAWARRRGRVCMVLNPAGAYQRDGGWRPGGNPRATCVHVIIGLSWYMGATPEQLHDIYYRLYTDRFR